MPSFSNGQITEVRLRQSEVTEKDITNKIYTPLVSLGKEFIAYYPVEKGSYTSLDHSYSGFNLSTVSKVEFANSESPVVHNAPMFVRPFALSISSTTTSSYTNAALDCPAQGLIGAAEFRDVETQPDGGTECACKRAYATISVGSPLLTPGFRIAAVNMKFVSQVQTEPSLEGYI
ncbi:hypothetical protein LY78DRAFT_682014 [Colletotrichum sublineola]|nr:hypothetical protein LY78DRAFT_682014 [Colletotrichum sublineola]